MSRIAIVGCVAGIALAAAPSAQAWPHPPRDLPLSHVCVPNRALSPALRAAAKVSGSTSGRALRWDQLCIKKVRYIIRTPAQIKVAAAMGVLWCIVVNSKPGSPFGTVLSMGAATRWCKGGDHRFWLYVQYR